MSDFLNIYFDIHMLSFFVLFIFLYSYHIMAFLQTTKIIQLHLVASFTELIYILQNNTVLNFFQIAETKAKFSRVDAI